MRSKFIGGMVCVAVVLGLMLVPAVPAVPAVSADGGDTVSLRMDPVWQRALPGDTFNIDVKVDITASEPVAGVVACIDFDETMFNVTDVIGGSGGPNSVIKNTTSNVAGQVNYTIGLGTVQPNVTASFTVCTLVCKAHDVVVDGTTRVDFVYDPIPNPPRYTAVKSAPPIVDYLNLTGTGNWAGLVTNATVEIGTPKLMVNVTPRFWAGYWVYAATILIAYNVTDWLLPCKAPNTEEPYENITLLYNGTFPNTTSWGWDECIVVAAVENVPGWEWASWTGESGEYNFTYDDTTTGYHVVGRTVKMDTMSKNLTANMAQKSPAVAVNVASLSYETFEGYDPSPQVFGLWNDGGGILNWTLTDNETPPGWLNENATSGSLTMDWYAQDIQYIVVSINTTGLAAGNYAGTINITGSNGVDIDVDLWVKPATAVDTFRTIMVSPNSSKPGETIELYAGETFEVFVNFTAPPTDPADGFNAIGLTDLAPPGWTVTVDKAWSWLNGTPDPALRVNAIGNKAEIMLAGPYDEGVQLKVKYNVTVPTTALAGVNTWPLCGNADEDDAWLEYYFNENGSYSNCISGDWEATVTQPGDIVGETREVNSDELSDVDVRLFNVADGYLWSDISSPDYVDTAWVTGMYWLEVNRTRFYDIDPTDTLIIQAPWDFGTRGIINLTTPGLLAAGYTFDFEGNYGLIPKAPTMSYTLKCVNLWQIGCTANPEYNLSDWKVADVCTAWLYPS